jgi:adenylate kinase family enzyme
MRDLLAEADEARAEQLQTEAEELVGKASRLLHQAREHKRSANRHRRRTRELHQQLDELVEGARRRGIYIRINAKAEGGPSVERAQTAPRGS